MAQGLTRRNPCHPGNRRGFTIVEMMITITVLGILAMVALPSLQGLIANQRVRNVTTDLMASLAFARSEAIKRNAQVNVVPTGGDWAGGWTVQTAGGATLRAQDPLSGIIVAGPAGNVTYQGNGRVVGAAAIGFTFRSSQVGSVTMRCLVLDPSGRPNIQLDNDTDTGNGCI
jgi:type IV fimbrial biogenesis protein FimT